MGRRLLASMTGDDRTEHLFEIANQFNRGTSLLTARQERIRIAEINLRAGRKAKASAAHASAARIFPPAWRCWRTMPGRANML